MAQPIHCDAPGCPELAVLIIGAITSGDQSAWCWDHYVASCYAVVEQNAQAEADAADAEAVARIAAVTPPAGSDQEPDVPASEPAPEPTVHMLPDPPSTGTPDAYTSEPSSGSGEPFPGTAKVVRRHHKPVQGAQERPWPEIPDTMAPTGTPDGIAAPGPSEAPTEDTTREE